MELVTPRMLVMHTVIERMVVKKAKEEGPKAPMSSFLAVVSHMSLTSSVGFLLIVK